MPLQRDCNAIRTPLGRLQRDCNGFRTPNTISTRLQCHCNVIVMGFGPLWTTEYHYNAVGVLLPRDCLMDPRIPLRRGCNAIVMGFGPFWTTEYHYYEVGMSLQRDCN